MMWMPSWTIRIVWPGIEPSSGSGSSERSHAMLSAPTANGRRSASQREPSRGHPAGRPTPRGRPTARPTRAAPAPRRPARISIARRRALQIGRRPPSARPRRRAARLGARSAPRCRSRAREAGRRLHARRDLDAAVHAALVGLMAERVDVRAGVLGHVRAAPTRRCAARPRRAHGGGAASETTPGSCAGMTRRARVAWLLEVVDASGEQLLDHSTARISRPCVSGSIVSAAMART